MRALITSMGIKPAPLASLITSAALAWSRTDLAAHFVWTFKSRGFQSRGRPQSMPSNSPFQRHFYDQALLHFFSFFSQMDLTRVQHSFYATYLIGSASPRALCCMVVKQQGTHMRPKLYLHQDYLTSAAVVLIVMKQQTNDNL